MALFLPGELASGAFPVLCQRTLSTSEKKTLLKTFQQESKLPANRVGRAVGGPVVEKSVKGSVH